MNFKHHRLKIKLLEKAFDRENIGRIQQQMEEQRKALQRAKDVKRKQKSRHEHCISTFGLLIVK